MSERATATRTTHEATPSSSLTARPSRAAAARLDPALTRLQRSHGNRYVQRVVATSRSAAAPAASFAPAASAASARRAPTAQGELSVGAANDAFEHEADSTADQVMRSIGSHTAPPPHQCGAGCVQRYTGPSGGPAAEVGTAGGTLTSGLSASISSARGGAPLPDGVRSSMESAFGADFSAVRVHAGSDLAGRVASTAFTLGRDIHFAPGVYRPGTRSGQWLLAHELTHVVQQNGSTGKAHRPVGSRIQRHASKEHYLLGALTTKEISNLANAKQSAATVNSKTMTAAKKRRRLQKMETPGSNRYDPDYRDAVQTISEQIEALNRWRDASPTDPKVGDVKRGGTRYDRSRGLGQNGEFDHKWGGQLVVIECRNGEELVCTIGDLNALPDFFGSIDDLKQADRIVVFKTLQVIRRETYIYLQTLLAELTGTSYTYNRTTEAFNKIRKNKVSLPGAGSDLGNAAFDVIQTEAMLAGNQDKGEVGLPTSIGASATLGRNACHFPPESWLRWLDHHRRARALINSASSGQDLEDKANRAIALNAFGEHYLQDSFAAGHLINKGFVMAEAMRHMTKKTRSDRGITKQQMAAFRKATAHRAAYDLPRAAKQRRDQEKANQPATYAQSLDKASVTRARDPQTALERARKLAPGGPTLRKMAENVEVEGIGLDPYAVDFDMYRTWLNDFWLQKITNTLHDKFCVEGLTVKSPAKRTLFTIYGDSHMLGSELGTEETALTSRMSHKAINALVVNKRRALTGSTVAPLQVHTEAAIMAHFPNAVEVAGQTISLEDWATGQHMATLIKNLVEVTRNALAEGKVTGLVRVVSPFKPVSAGLGAQHAPF